MVYPLSYEGLVPICRGFTLTGPDKNTTELLIACESCCKLTSACSRAALVT